MPLWSSLIMFASHTHMLVYAIYHGQFKMALSVRIRVFRKASGISGTPRWSNNENKLPYQLFVITLA